MATLVKQQFTGTKTVDACKMSRKEAEEIIGRKVRPDSDEIEDELGYLVVYPDGYQSWSPKKAFEEAYRVSETHFDRMVIEKEDLEKRFLEARKFTFSESFRRLNDDQRFLLLKQCDQMEAYLYTLCKRIDNDKSINFKRQKDAEACTGQRRYDGPLDENGESAKPLREKHD